MRKRRNVILALAIGSWLAIACGSGNGPLATLDDGRDPPPITGRDNPGAGRDNPGAGRDVPPASGDNPGARGGGGGAGGGGATGCPPCNAKLECLVGTQKSSLTLKTVNGQCTAGDNLILDCAGKVVQNGTVVGSWSIAGDSYTFSVTDKGKVVTATCTKGATTTVPTSTGTAPPLDAGIKG